MVASLPIWIQKDIDKILFILDRVKLGQGLNQTETASIELTSLFNKLSQYGCIRGTYYVGYKVTKNGAKITPKGEKLLRKVEAQVCK